MLDTARQLYASAEYDTALTMLNGLMTSSATREERRTVALYRTLCLLATNRRADFDQFVHRDGLSGIPADATDQQSGTAIVTSAAGTKVLGQLEEGDWALYGGVDLGARHVSAASVEIEASSVGGGFVEIWLDPLAGGPHFGPCPITATGSLETFGVTSCPVPAQGTHDVYLKVVGKPGTELMRIASLRFVP